MSVVALRNENERLAPPPDFRYVAFGPAPRGGIRLAGSLVTAGATAEVAVLFHASTLTAALFGVGIGLLTALSMRLRNGPVRNWSAHAWQLGFTPWGVIIEPEQETLGRDPRSEDSRVLRWAAIGRLHVESIFGRDSGTPSTLFSNVILEAGKDRFVGRTPGAAPLDSILIHMDAYAREQGHQVALDLDGNQPSDGPVEPEVEPLLGAAEAFIESAASSTRLGLPPAGYRKASARTATATTLSVLRAVLRDRSVKQVDPRAFAATLAAELNATELVPELIALSQSPHPLLAAVARVAARKLGVAASKVGSLEEVTPFLLAEDVVRLTEWAAASSNARESVRTSAL